MEPALLDTDILLEVLKAKNSTVVARATAYQAAFSELTISVVTVMEIVQGFQKMKQTEHYQRIQALGYSLKLENWRQAQ